jgi:hypothetical protein
MSQFSPVYSVEQAHTPALHVPNTHASWQSAPSLVGVTAMVSVVDDDDDGGVIVVVCIRITRQLVIRLVANRTQIKDSKLTVVSGVGAGVVTGMLVVIGSVVVEVVEVVVVVVVDVVEVVVVVVEAVDVVEVLDVVEVVVVVVEVVVAVVEVVVVVVEVVDVVEVVVVVVDVVVVEVVVHGLYALYNCCNIVLFKADGINMNSSISRNIQLSDVLECPLILLNGPHAVAWVPISSRLT